jgi:hypothetical protein
MVYWDSTNMLLRQQITKNTTPLTISIIGVNRRLLGVKVVSFDLEECVEHGVFITATPNDWDLRGSDKIYKAKASV